MIRWNLVDRASASPCRSEPPLRRGKAWTRARQHRPRSPSRSPPPASASARTTCSPSTRAGRARRRAGGDRALGDPARGGPRVPPGQRLAARAHHARGDRDPRAIARSVEPQHVHAAHRPAVARRHRGHRPAGRRGGVARGRRAPWARSAPRSWRTVDPAGEAPRRDRAEAARTGGKRARRGRGGPERRAPDGARRARRRGRRAPRCRRAAAAARPAPAPPPLPIAEVIPLRDGDRPVSALAGWTTPTMGATVAFGSSEGRELQRTLVPGAPALVRPIGSGVLRTVPVHALQGAGGGRRHRQVGALEHAAGMAATGGRRRVPAPAPAPSAPAPPAARTRTRRPGRRSRRSAHRQDRGLPAGRSPSPAPPRTASSSPAARTHRARPLARRQAHRRQAACPSRRLAFARLDPAGRALVATTTTPAPPPAPSADDGANAANSGGKLHAFVARGAAPARARFRPDAGRRRASPPGARLDRRHRRRADRGAAPHRRGVRSLESGAAAPQALHGPTCAGCTANAALLQQRNTARYVVPDADAAALAALSGMQPSKLATPRRRRAGRGRAPRSAPRRLRAKGPPATSPSARRSRSLQLALSDGKVIDLVAQSAPTASSSSASPRANPRRRVRTAPRENRAATTPDMLPRVIRRGAARCAPRAPTARMMLGDCRRVGAPSARTCVLGCPA